MSVLDMNHVHYYTKRVYQTILQKYIVEQHKYCFLNKLATLAVENIPN